VCSSTWAAGMVIGLRRQEIISVELKVVRGKPELPD
jgi:hypothetical protein